MHVRPHPRQSVTSGCVLAATQVLHTSTDNFAERLDELSREVISLSNIRHGNIVAFYGITVLHLPDHEPKRVIGIVTERFVRMLHLDM